MIRRSAGGSQSDVFGHDGSMRWVIVWVSALGFAACGQRGPPPARYVSDTDQAACSPRCEPPFECRSYFSPRQKPYKFFACFKPCQLNVHCGPEETCNCDVWSAGCTTTVTHAPPNACVGSGR